MWWKMDTSSASLLISTLNSYTGVRSRLRRLQMVAQWVLCSQGRETFGGLLSIWWTINSLVYFPANGNNCRPMMVMCFLPLFLESDNFVTQFLSILQYFLWNHFFFQGALWEQRTSRKPNSLQFYNNFGDTAILGVSEVFSQSVSLLNIFSSEVCVLFLCLIQSNKKPQHSHIVSGTAKQKSL